MKSVSNLSGFGQTLQEHILVLIHILISYASLSSLLERSQYVYANFFSQIINDKSLENLHRCLTSMK